MRKILNYTSFYNSLGPLKVFSREQAEQFFPKFDSRRLFEWKQKDYLHKLTNKWYCFTNIPNTIGVQYLISNSLCKPSYISLESALCYYQLMNVAPPLVHAITQHKTVMYDTPKGNYNYRKIKPSLFLGFDTIELDGIKIHMACKEKALVDFLYFNASLNSLSKLSSINWDSTQMELLNWKLVADFQKSFQSKALNRRVDLLKKLLKIGVI
jgi:predicted transcriptional regulator of viral defense system